MCDTHTAPLSPSSADLLYVQAGRAKAGAGTPAALQRLTKIAAVQISRRLIAQMVGQPDLLSHLLRHGFLDLDVIYNMIVHLAVVEDTSGRNETVKGMVAQLMTGLEYIATRWASVWICRGISS